MEKGDPTVNFSTKVDTLQQHVTDTKVAAESAVSESRDKLQQRINQAQVDVHLAMMDAKEDSEHAAAATRGKWAQLKADVAAHVSETQARLNTRGAQIDARLAEADANMAEADAEDAIDFAAWAIDNARLAMLSAIASRANSDELAATARG
jgi:hypothetical protein